MAKNVSAALRPWGWATPRRVRGRDGRIGLTRLRRVRCRACKVSHVLLPAAGLPRRLDQVDVIGAALLGAACGAGHRPLAARLTGRRAPSGAGYARPVSRPAGCTPSSPASARSCPTTANGVDRGPITPQVQPTASVDIQVNEVQTLVTTAP